MPIYNVSNWHEAILIAGSNILTGVLAFLPTLIGALLLFLAGLLLGKWARLAIVKTLKAVNLSKLAKTIGFEKVWKKAEVDSKIEEVLGEIVRWLIIIVFFVASVNLLGLTTVSEVLTGILGYLPRVISAVLVLMGGVLLASLVENVVKGALAQIDPKLARLLAKVASYLLVIFTILTAINELGIAQSFINALFYGVIAMLALGIGLAVGLGAKDLVAQVLEDWYQQLKKDVKKK